MNLEPRPMSARLQKRGRSSLGVSLVETLVVMAILSLLAALSLMGIQHTRAAARRTSCQSNLHQLSIALRTFVHLKKRLPNPPLTGTVGGWTIELMPFLEDTLLAEALIANPSLAPGTMSPLLRQRPAILTCPAAYDGDSTVEGVPASHYLFIPPENRRLLLKKGCTFIDVPTDCRSPWATGLEPSSLSPVNQDSQGPHSGDANSEYVRES
jgi:type II secretory pathway pseudopilin PulG